MQRAFTLVELAIVLIIMGFIVSGIFAGQELIKQAQLRKHVSSINEVNLAWLTFQSKYNGLPGDIKNPTRFLPACYPLGTGCDGCPGDIQGDGDGVISGITTDGSSAEAHCVWFHMLHSGLYPHIKPMSASAIYPSVPPVDVNFTNEGYYYVYWPVDSSLFMIVLSEIASQYNRKRNAWGVGLTLLPEQAYSIDVKLDDGNPWSGIVKGSTKNSSACISNVNVDQSICDGVFCPTALSQYIFTSNTNDCGIMLPLD